MLRYLEAIHGKELPKDQIMAITITPTITPTNDPNIVGFSAAFVDDVAGTTIIAGMRSADISTGPKKLAAMNIVWDKYQDKLAKQAQIDAAIGTLEADAKANLEARL